MDTNGKRSRKYLFRVIGVAILLATILGVNYIASLCFGQVRVADYYKYAVLSRWDTPMASTIC